MIKNKWIKTKGIMLLSLSLILFTQWAKHIKNPESMPVTRNTVIGLLCLGLFAFLGIFLREQCSNIKGLGTFPVIGWVSVISLCSCLAIPSIIQFINEIDFLSLTTPVLAFAGISVANRLDSLKKLSWKIIIVGCFVFIGTYLCSAIIAEIGLHLFK